MGPGEEATESAGEGFDEEVHEEEEEVVRAVTSNVYWDLVHVVPLVLEG